MTNPTVMGFGIVMVAAHFVRMFRSRKKTKIISKKNITNTLIYGCCFLPCLIPFIWFYCNLGTFNPTSGGSDSGDYLPRMLSYLFDPNIGFTSFAGVTLIVFAVMAVISLRHRGWDAIEWTAFILIPLLAYSLMEHLNCGYLTCARYVMWNYPALLLGTVILAGRIEKHELAMYITAGLTSAASIFFSVINTPP